MVLLFSPDPIPVSPRSTAGFSERHQQPLSSPGPVEVQQTVQHGESAQVGSQVHIRHKDEGKEMSWSEKEEEDGDRDEGSSSVDEPLVTQGCILTASAAICVDIPC